MVRFALAVRRGGFDFGAANGVLLLACLRFGSWQVVPEGTATMRSTQARGGTMSRKKMTDIVGVVKFRSSGRVVSAPRQRRCS